MPDNFPNRYKIIVLIGGELDAIQMVIPKYEDEFQAVVVNETSWETRIYKESNSGNSEFVLQR